MSRTAATSGRTRRTRSTPRSFAAWSARTLAPAWWRSHSSKRAEPL